jgi:hypothetical protein
VEESVPYILVHEDDADSILSEDSQRNIKPPRELTLLHYYGMLGKPGK